MLIIMKPRVTQDSIDNVVKFIKNLGYEAHISNGELHTVIGAVGNKIIDKRDVELLDKQSIPIRGYYSRSQWS